MRSDREVTPLEQHIRGFLESLPFGALSALMCLHPDQVKALLRGGRGHPDAWRPVPRRRRPLSLSLSRDRLAGIAVAIGTCVALPYGEEPVRCVRAARREENRATSDGSNWLATKGC